MNVDINLPNSQRHDFERKMSSSVHMQSRRITLATIGTRGDVQPLIALAQALIKKGHIVKIATELRLKSYVEAFGITHVALYGDSVEYVVTNSRYNSGSEGTLFSTLSTSEQKEPNAALVLQSYRVALADAEVIVATSYAINLAYSVAQSLRVPFVPLFLQPVMPTSEFVSLFTTPLLDRLCFFNKKWTHKYLFSSAWGAHNKALGQNEWRQNTLGLPPIGKYGMLDELCMNPDIPVLMACSTLTCGRNKCKPKDYDDRMHVGGLLFVEYKEPTIDPRLLTFLSQEDMSRCEVEEGKVEVSSDSFHKKRPIIYISYGSMTIPDPLSFLRMVCEVCTMVQCRAVLVAGWSDFAASTSCIEVLNAHEGTVFLAQSVNHEWLFPRMQCIVHHCGMGTMGAVLRSGTPSIPCPKVYDQLKLAKLLVDHGLAPCQIPFDQINKTNLSKALKMIFDAKYSADYDQACILKNCEETAKYVEQESKDSLMMYCDVIASADGNKQWKKYKASSSAPKVTRVANSQLVTTPQAVEFLTNLHLISGPCQP